MKEYEEVYEDIREYFRNLGYVETMFENDVAFSNQYSNVSKVDFIVKQANAPFIVVELKLAKTFENIDNEKLKYDPSVRQVQTYAMSLGAPYYVVTNGNNFLWFDTSEDGRPRKIEPVFYKSGDSNNVLGVTVGEALNICRELLKSDSMTSDFMHELVLILLARFAVRNNVSTQNISFEINNILENYYSFDVNLISRANPKILENCWFILSECRPENANKNQLISTLRLLAQKSKNNYNIRLNEKLSEFLFKLAKVSDIKVILDPVANLGEISFSTAIERNQNHVYSYCQSIEQYAFLALLNKIMYNDIRNTSLISIEDFILKSTERLEKPDVIISAFPFSNRFNNTTELRYRMPIDISSNIEDYMLIASLEALKENGRLVAIVPDSMLFAGGKRKLLRRYIVERYNLRSVISLPAGAISNSNAKTSIIVIDKTRTVNGSVFFGVVNSTNFAEKRLFIDDNGNPIGLLKAYEDYLCHNIIKSNDWWKSFFVGPNIENIRAETFLSINDTQMESQYPLYSIKDICLSVKRGTSIKNDDNGMIPFLGPAAIRVNKVDETKSSFTTEEHLKKSVLYVQKGTVVVNNISSYLGAAAIVENDEPIAINQHVIALTPNIETVLPQYLAIALNNRDVNSNILRASTGVAIPSITLENLKEIQIPVPDLATQQKIINSVNEIQDKLAILEETKSELEKRLTSIINCLDLEEV
jgi:type I restriction-modification system DNA methylase subunit